MSDTNTEQTNDTSWRDKTLKMAGAGYIVGDIAGVAASMARGGFKPNFAAAGGFATWAAGGLGAAFYGNPGTDKQIDILAHKLEAYLIKQGAKVTDVERNRAELLRGRGGVGAKIDRFLHEHPTELLNGAYAVGAAMLMKEGLSSGRPVIPKAMNMAAFKNTSSVFWFGSLVLAGALGGLLIKEDPDARAKADQSSITSRVAAFVKEKPMRWSSAFYWGGNAFALKKAFDERATFPASGTAGMKPYWFSFLTVAAYVVSNGLLSISSRDQIREDRFKPEHLAQLEQAATEIIVSQPPEVQAQLLRGVAEYMARERQVGKSAEQLTQELIARVSETSKRHLAQQTQNDWAGRVSAQTSAAVPTLG